MITPNWFYPEPQSFCTAGSTDDVDDDVDDNGNDEKTYMAAEELFYLDTGGEKSQVDQVQVCN